MTTIPGHNIILQQSGAAREAAYQNRPLQPDPDQFAAQQAAREVLEKATVQESQAAEKIRADREEAEKKKKRQEQQEKLKKEKRETERDQDPDATGRLLNTVV